MQSDEILARNNDIVRFYLENHTISATGIKFGLTHQRVHQIIVSQGILPRKKAPNTTSKKIQPPPVDRFWGGVDKQPGHGPNGDCWVWTRFCTPAGYGRIWFRGKLRYAHHVSFLLTNGHRAVNWHLHKCDNPPCVNPAHIYDGTPSQNAKDRVDRGRSGDRKGAHPCITESRVVEIQKLLSEGVPQRKIAIITRTATKTINLINTGKWAGYAKAHQGRDCNLFQFSHQ